MCRSARISLADRCVLICSQQSLFIVSLKELFAGYPGTCCFAPKVEMSFLATFWDSNTAHEVNVAFFPSNRISLLVETAQVV